MSALERLTAYLCSGPGTEAMDAWHAEWAEGILRMHAHELAEEIRDVASKTRMAADRPALRHAADLIDPEAS